MLQITEKMGKDPSKVTNRIPSKKITDRIEPGEKLRLKFKRV